MPEVIKRRRMELGMSQAELAEQAGVDQRQIRRYESGEAQPNLAAARSLARALGITIDALASDPAVEDITGRWWMAWKPATAAEPLLVHVEIAHAASGYSMTVSDDPESSPHFPDTWRATLTRNREGSYMGYSVSLMLPSILLLESRGTGWFGQWIRLPIGPKNIGQLALARDRQDAAQLMVDSSEGLAEVTTSAEYGPIRPCPVHQRVKLRVRRVSVEAPRAYFWRVRSDDTCQTPASSHLHSWPCF